MSKIVSSKDFVAIITKQNIHLFNQHSADSSILPSDKDAEVDLDIDFAAFSPSHQHLAVLYSDKSLKIWKRLDATEPMQWSPVKTAVVPRRSLALAFDAAEAVVYVGDKCGNVYTYQVVGGEGEEKKPPVIGHISMLLDVACTRDYVVTADRDERVRVSDVTRPHVIRSFCLGHQEFVCRCMAVCDGRNLLTTSGDGSLKLWRLESGDELATLQVVQDLSSQAVPNVVCERNGLVVVSSQKSTAFHVVSLDDSSLTERYSVALPAGQQLVSCSFASDSLLHVLTTDAGKFGLVSYQVTASGYDLVSSDEKVEKFISSIPYQSQDHLADFSGWFKQSNCQNQRYKGFFDLIQKRSAAAAQNENGFIVDKKAKTEETRQ